MRMTIGRAVTVFLFVCGAAYSVGRVHATVDAHEKLDGHAVTANKVQDHAVLLAKLTVVVELLEKRVK